MGRGPCCDKVGLNKGAWTAAEDMRLISYIQKHGHQNWRTLPKQAGLLRCGKSCRLRWINYLRPDIKRGNFTTEEEANMIRLHGLLGNKWSKIASCLPGRTDNEIKNFWNTHIKKRLLPKEAKDVKPSDEKSRRQASSPPFSSSSNSFGDPHEQDDGGKHTQPLVVQLDSCPVSESTPSACCTCTSLAISSTDSYIGGSEREEKNQVSLMEIADFPIDPELWCFINDDSWLFSSAVDPLVGDGGDMNPTTSEQYSTSEAGDNRWVAYLEKELDL